MFCFQCQETAGGTGCRFAGVCGKTSDVAGMQDLLIYVTKGLSAVTTALRKEGKEVSEEVNHLVSVNLFTTITNANFDQSAIEDRIEKTLITTQALKDRLNEEDRKNLPEASLWYGSRNEYRLKAMAEEVGVLSTKNEDIRSLRELITYGLKGLAAYSKHAMRCCRMIRKWMRSCRKRWQRHWMTV